MGVTSQVRFPLGITVVGIISLVASVLLTICFTMVAVVCFLIINRDCNSYYGYDHPIVFIDTYLSCTLFTQVGIVTIIGVVATLLEGIASILLLISIKKDNNGMMIFYIVWTCITTVMLLVIDGFAISPLPTAAIIASVFGILIEVIIPITCIVVVYKHYEEVSKAKLGMVTPIVPQYPIQAYPIQGFA